MKKKITIVLLGITAAVYVGSYIAAIVHINIIKNVFAYWGEIYGYGDTLENLITMICMILLEGFIYLIFAAGIFNIAVRAKLLPNINDATRSNIAKTIINCLFGGCIYYLGVACIGILRVLTMLVGALVWLIMNLIVTIFTAPFNMF